MMNKYRLMSPGPTPIPPEVSAAGAMPIIHHRTPEFGEVFTRVNESLKRIFLTENDIFTYAASGTGAFEGAIQNLFSPGDKVLVVNNGNFGNRWVKMSKAFGLEVENVSGCHRDGLRPKVLELPELTADRFPHLGVDANSIVHAGPDRL